MAEKETPKKVFKVEEQTKNPQRKKEKKEVSS